MNLFENLQDLNEKLIPVKESAFDNDFILDIVKMGYETGHQIFDSYEDFIEDEEVQDIDDKEAAWDFYCDLIDMGPTGFYEEYRDELDFDPSFIAEYGEDDEELEESKIIKDEKDIEQIIEGKEIKTEDSNDPKEIFANKTKKWAEKIDTLANIINENELHKFLSSLSPDLDMDVYTSGELYPSDPDGYFSNGSLAELNLNDEYDAEEFNWVNEQLDDFTIKLDEKIKSTIEDLENKIKSIEQDISDLKSALTL